MAAKGGDFKMWRRCGGAIIAYRIYPYGNLLGITLVLDEMSKGGASGIVADVVPLFAVRRDGDGESKYKTYSQIAPHQYRECRKAPCEKKAWLLREEDLHRVRGPM